MDNRFTFKDFVLVVLLVGVIGVVILAMWQFSYQEQRLTEVKKSIERLDSTQRDQLAVLERMERQGLRVQGGGTSASAGGTTRPAESGIQRTKLEDGSIFVSSPAIPPIHRDPIHNPDYARGDWVIRNYNAEPAIIAPFIYKDLYGQESTLPVLESLVTQDLDTWEYVPWLAESYKISPDGLTFTFVIRREAKFSDGKPVTADDVVFSFSTIKDPKIDAASLQSYFASVKSCEKVDDRTVVFTYEKPYFKAISIVGGLTIIPKHIYAYKTPEEFNSRNALLVGTGPYKVEKWETGQQLIYSRNDNYWAGRPTFDRLVFKFIKNPQASLQEFLAGKLDMFDALPDQFEKYSQDQEFLSRAKAYKFPTPLSGFSFMAWNLAKPQFKDKQTRRALTMLVDRNAIIDTFLKKMAIPTSGPFAPQSPQYNQSLAPLPYSVDEAKRLLAEAGWRLNANGVLEREGVEFKFDISMGAGNPLAERIASYVKEQFRSAGIVMSIQPFEFSVLMQRVDQRNFDALMMGWSSSIESDPYQVWHSSQIAGSGDNAISFRNEEADKFIEAARTEIDTDKRMKLWQEFHRVVHEEQPYLFLYSRMERVFVDGRFKNTEPYKTGMYPEYWYVPRASQRYK